MSPLKKFPITMVPKSKDSKAQRLKSQKAQRTKESNHELHYGPPFLITILHPEIAWWRRHLFEEFPYADLQYYCYKIFQYQLATVEVKVLIPKVWAFSNFFILKITMKWVGGVFWKSRDRHEYESWRMPNLLVIIRTVFEIVFEPIT